MTKKRRGKINKSVKQEEGKKKKEMEEQREEKKNIGDNSNIILKIFIDNDDAENKYKKAHTPTKEILEMNHVIFRPIHVQTLFSLTSSQPIFLLWRAGEKNKEKRKK